MIGYTITGYDVSRIKCTAEDIENDMLPTNVREGSIAIAVDPAYPADEECRVFWKGGWIKFAGGR